MLDNIALPILPAEHYAAVLYIYEGRAEIVDLFVGQGCAENALDSLKTRIRDYLTNAQLDELSSLQWVSDAGCNRAILEACIDEASSYQLNIVDCIPLPWL